MKCASPTVSPKGALEVEGLSVWLSCSNKKTYIDMACGLWDSLLNTPKIDLLSANGYKNLEVVFNLPIHLTLWASKKYLSQESTCKSLNLS